MDLKEEDILGEDIGGHWYYRAKLAALQSLVEKLPCRRILDVGAGSGFFSRGLLATPHFDASTCVDPGYAADRNELYRGKPIAFRASTEHSDADLVLLMDVLEHVDDDVGLLRSYMRLVQPGSYFLVTVPAFRFLWSDHDVFLEHKRRYTRTGMDSVLRAAGLTLVHSNYYFGAILPLVAATRLLPKLTGAGGAPRSSLKRHSPLVNTMLETVCLGEIPVMRANKLGGLSVFALARN